MSNWTPLHEMNAAQLEAALPIDDACSAYLVAGRWPEGVCCPRCRSHDVWRLKSAKWKWRCPACGKGGAYHFSHIAGTVLENTKIPLRNWFRLLNLKLNSTDEINAVEVRQRLSFSYKTAWTMCHRVDAVLMDSSFRKVVGLPAIKNTLPGEAADRALAQAPLLGGVRGKTTEAPTPEGRRVAIRRSNTDRATRDAALQPTTS